MRKTEYESVKQIEDLFDQGWVPFEKKGIGFGESGVNVYWIIDKKSGVMYIERFNPVTEEMTVYAFDKDKHPLDWVLEEGGNIKVKI